MKMSSWALEHIRFALMVVLFVGLPTLFGFPGSVVLLWLEGLISIAMGAFQWIGLTRLFDGEKTGFNRFGLDWLAITLCSGGAVWGVFFFGFALSAPGSRDALTNDWGGYTLTMMILTGVPALLVGLLTSGSQVSLLRKCWPTATTRLGRRWFWASYMGWSVSWASFGAAVGLVLTYEAGPIFNQIRLFMGLILLPLSWAFYGLATGWALADVDSDKTESSTQPVKVFCGRLPPSSATPAPKRYDR